MLSRCAFSYLEDIINGVYFICPFHISEVLEQLEVKLAREADGVSVQGGEDFG